MRKTKKKSRFAFPLLALVVCLVIVTGSTFSLFTSETGANIAITSGTVKMTADILDSSLTLTSKGIAQTGGTFANGGTAKIVRDREDSNYPLLDLDRITPGDRVEFSITITNSSNVKTAYRVIWTEVENSIPDLGVYIKTTDGEEEVLTSLVYGTSEWQYLEANANGESETITINLVIELPIDADNDNQTKSAKIDFAVEGVQANAVQAQETPVMTADELYVALAMNGYAVLGADIDLQRPLSISADKTAVIYLAGHSITNANGDAIVNNGTLTINPGNPPVETTRASRKAAEGMGTSVPAIVSGNGSAIVNNGTLTINGGNFEGTKAAAISNTKEAVKLVVTDGNFTSNIKEFAIEYAESENVIISGGKFSGEIDNEELQKITDAGIGATIEGGNLVFAPATVTIDSANYVTLEDAAAAAKSGDVIKLLEDVTLAAELTLPADVTLNGNGKQINGTIYAGGNLTFVGHTKITAFSASYYNRVITIGEGACLEITGGGRVSLAYGNTFNITGSIENAKTANKADLTPSLIIPAGISITGGSDATMNVTNAYVVIGDTSSKNSVADGEFNINFVNSYVEFTKQFTFAEPTGGKTPTFNLNIEDSVMTTGAKFVVAAPDSSVVIDNSIVTLGTYFRNSGNTVIKNGSVFTGATIQFGENGGNNGNITVDASKFTVACSSSGHAMDGKNVGTLNVVNGAEASVDYVKDMAITVDTESTFTAKELNNVAITIDAAEWNGSKSLVFPGRTTIPANVSIINTTREHMLKVTDAGVIVMVPAKGSVSPAYTSGTTFWGEGGGNASESLVVSIYEGDKVIATASLNNIGGIIDGDVYVTWNIPFAGSNDEYWTVEWAEGYPNVLMTPTKVTMTIDGTEVAESDHRWNGPDDLNKIVALAEGSTGGVKAYTNITDAMGKFNGRTVRVLHDVTANITGFYGVEFVTTVEGGVTITNTYTEEWIDFDDVIIGKGVTVNATDVYSGDSENVVMGTFNVTGTYYHGYDAKTTVKEGGKIVVDGTTIVRYNKKADSGIYIYGDGDDSTVEFDCSYYIGAYSGTFYAKDATVKAGYFLLKNSYDNDNYADIYLTLDKSSIKIVGTTDTQDSFHIDDKAHITMKNGSAIKDVRDFNILAGAKLTLDVDASSYFNATYVNIATNVPYDCEKDENNNFQLVAKA